MLYCQWMTTLIAWIALDSRGPSALYFASDSKVSWSGGSTRENSCRKVFASRAHPHAIGFYGDVPFATHVIDQVLNLIDHGLVFSPGDSSEIQHQRVAEAIKGMHASGFGIAPRKVSILHAIRTVRGNYSRFRIWQLSFDGLSWRDVEITIFYDRSNLIGAWGTGEGAIRSAYDKWFRSGQSGTSRTIYSALCDALQLEEDTQTGGAPQLVSIRRDATCADCIGSIYRGRRYFMGSQIEPKDSIDLNVVEWRDELFNRIDGNTMTQLHGSQKQVRDRPARDKKASLPLPR